MSDESRPPPDGQTGRKHTFLNRLFTEQGQPLLRFLGARLRDSDLADEVAQEAWVRLHRLDHPEELENARAFLFQTAANLAIDRLRKQNLERRWLQQESAAIDAGSDSTSEPSAERRVSAEEELAMVYEAISELPLKCRQAFILHRGRDMSYAAIARELDVSVSMVEKYIIQALRHCRRRLVP